MWSKFLLVGLGGAAGSMLRYFCQRSLNAGFPTGTLFVNLGGCLLIGILWGMFAKGNEVLKLLLLTGFCGGFTTFSAFTQETTQLMLGQHWIKAVFYAAASVAGGIIATFIGYKIAS